jgi:hypothetical protein
VQTGKGVSFQFGHLGKISSRSAGRDDSPQDGHAKAVRSPHVVEGNRSFHITDLNVSMENRWRTETVTKIAGMTGYLSCNRSPLCEK